MSKNIVLKKDPNMVTRRIDEETILVPILKSSDEINCIYSLNESASVVWDMIDGKKTEKEIEQKVLKRFDITPKDGGMKLKEILKDLKRIKAVS